MTVCSIPYVLAPFRQDFLLLFTHCDVIVNLRLSDVFLQSFRAELRRWEKSELLNLTDVTEFISN